MHCKYFVNQYVKELECRLYCSKCSLELTKEFSLLQIAHDSNNLTGHHYSSLTITKTKDTV